MIIIPIYIQRNTMSLNVKYEDSLLCSWAWLRRWFRFHHRINMSNYLSLHFQKKFVIHDLPEEFTNMIDTDAGIGLLHYGN